MAIVTISRGSMSGGQILAERVARELGVPCIGREIVMEAAASLGVSRDFLSEKLEKAPGFWERLTSARHTYVLAVQTALAEFAASGDLVYHGQAGHMHLRDLPGVLRVRLIAPFEMRVDALVRQRGLDRGEAEAYVRQIDEDRVRWTRFMYDVDLRDPALYDLVINLEVTTMDTASALVVEASRRPEFATGAETGARIAAFASRCRHELDRIRGERSQSAPVRVLVVGGEADFAMAAAERLGKRGYLAQAVLSESEALARIYPGTFDVVVLDLKTTTADGHSILRLFRNKDPLLRIVVLSGQGNVAEGIEDMKIGAADFLLKPVDMDTLCASIDAMAETVREQRQIALERTSG